MMLSYLVTKLLTNYVPIYLLTKQLISYHFESLSTVVSVVKFLLLSRETEIMLRA